MRGLAFGLGPFSYALEPIPRNALHCHVYTGTVDVFQAPPHNPPGGPMPCDCAATREELAAGIHAPNCTSTEGPVDDPSDHYQH